MKRTAVIGQLHFKKNDMIGAVVKTRSVYECLKSKYGGLITYVDIYGGNKRIPIVLFQILIVFLICRNVIVVTSAVDGIYLKYLSALQILFKTNMVYIAIGGNTGDHIEKNPSLLKNLSCFSAVLVETQRALEQMQSVGGQHTDLLRNFKKLPVIYDGNYRRNNFCTFSRVIKNKGISDAINAIKEISIERPDLNVKLDIYGPIDDSYKEEFFGLLDGCPAIQYKGCVDSKDASRIISDYYCLLFPTRFVDEGIPGTIIDALSAGTPIIASYWYFFNEILSEGETALGFKIKDILGLKNAVYKAIENPWLIDSMREKCRLAYRSFGTDYALEILEDKLI